jgi:RimJ/RimL family protein N-acetyltransferase
MIINNLKEKLKDYDILPITEENIEEAFQLMRSNTYFYSRTQFHELTLQECKEDITALPPGTTLDQKFFVGIYEIDKLVAVLDYIEGYPEKEIAFIGFFMLANEVHGKGIGKKMIQAFIESAKQNHFKEVRLGCYETNEIGYLFGVKWVL